MLYFYRVINLEYKKTSLKQEFVVENLVSINKIDLKDIFKTSNISFNSWKIIYVEKGEVTAKKDNKIKAYKQGELIFLKPSEQLTFSSNSPLNSNLVAVCFDCHCISMDYFFNKSMLLNSDQKNLLSQILKESELSPYSSLQNQQHNRLSKTLVSNFGSEQIIKNSLELLLISLRRTEQLSFSKSANSYKERSPIADKVVVFLKKNLEKSISFLDVINYTNISATTLKQVFKKAYGVGIMKYYNYLKIEKAKAFIREKNFNFSQIANILAFESVHYFSAKFKAVTGMTPSEYLKSIKM